MRVVSTRKGRELALKLAEAIGVGAEINDTLSLVSRHAVTLQWLSETLANGGDDRLPDDVRHRQIADAERRSEHLQARITELVASLPDTDAGPVGVIFQGDPRGMPVKLAMPGEWSRLHDDWAQEGVCVPL